MSNQYFSTIESFIEDTKQFNSFSIQSSIRNYLLPERLHSTEISKHPKYNTLEFKRDFTFSEGTEYDFVSAIKVEDSNKIVYTVTLSNDEVLTIEARHEEQNTEPCTLGDIDMFTLMNPAYIDEERSSYNENHDSYICVVDIRKLGILNDNQKKQIKYIMYDVARHDMSDSNTLCYVITRVCDDPLLDSMKFGIGLYSLDGKYAWDVQNHYADDDWDMCREKVTALREFGKELTV